MKRTVCILCCLLAVILALPALAELEFGPWQHKEGDQWKREVRDGENTGVQLGSGPDAEHVEGLHFSIEDKDTSKGRTYYYPDGRLNYTQVILEDGTRYQRFFRNGELEKIQYYKTDADTTSIRRLRPDETLMEEVLYQGSEHRETFTSITGKLYDEAGKQYAYWDMVHVRTNEHGDWERRKTTRLMDGRVIEELLYLYPAGKGSVYVVGKTHYTEDGRLTWDSSQNFYDGSYSKRELILSDNGVFTTLYYRNGPEPGKPLLEDSWYRYEADGTFIEGEAYNPDTQKKQLLIKGPAQDALRDGWLAVGP